MTGSPVDGRELYLWAKLAERRQRVGLVKYLDAWRAVQGLPWTWADWSEEDVRRAYESGLERLAEPRWWERLRRFIASRKAP